AHNQSLPVGLEQCEIQADSDHVFIDRTTGDVSGRLSLCSVIEKILKKICICQKPRIPGKEGCKDEEDRVERKDANFPYKFKRPKRLNQTKYPRFSLKDSDHI